MSGDAGAAAPGDAAPPRTELLRVDPRLLGLVASLFWATFPSRRLGRATPDGAGLVPLLVDAPLNDGERGRWARALDALLTDRAGAGAYLREVRDRAGRRDELALPVAPDAYAGGARLVGPFADAAAADRWAASRLARPWVHDAVPHAGAVYADVFVGDPDAATGG